jgi:sugar lactone lactonase YvrE
MKDLRLIFLWTDQNTLVSFSTVDKKFTKNNLPLASGSTVTGLGAYLTYLYVFDNRQGNIYRFPRTEGGFAEGSSWLKSPLPEKENLSFAVSDTIRIGGKTTKQYLKGNLEKTLSDEPHSLLVTSSNGSFVLGVATGTDKLTIWNADGGVVLTKSLPAVQSASHMSYDENAKKLYIAKEGRILSQDLSW